MLFFSSSRSGMKHSAPPGLLILGTRFRVGDVDFKACEGLLESALEAFLPTN